MDQGRCTERVHFRLLQMQCCNVLLCHVNPRLPNYCCECGKYVYPQVKQWIVGDCDSAMIRYQFATVVEIDARPAGEVGV